MTAAACQWLPTLAIGLLSLSVPCLSSNHHSIPGLSFPAATTLAIFRRLSPTSLSSNYDA